ncbi:MAG TPA: hypothetical protein VGL56_20235 [Fimbriimonadaceae bacterium]|jgi:predicted aspartyl protease
MLKGRFGDTSGRPYLEAKIFLPRLNVSGDISFLVDTGADTCILMPSDGIRLGIDYALLRGNRECQGIGCTIHTFVEKAILVFSDEKAVYTYSVDLDIHALDASLESVPSLLGREVLDRWSMNYNPSKNQLTFAVVTSDATFPL